MRPLILSIVFCSLVIFYSGCEKEKEEEIPPEISFKTGATYTSSDVTVAPGSSVTVGIVVVKVEDDLKSYNVSVAYDGATTTTTIQDFTIPDAEKEHYEKDVTFSVRNMVGTEKYYFTITDSDGNIAQLSLTITVN